MAIKIYSAEEIVNYARTHSKYYADLYRDVPGDAPFEALPLVNQDDFWAHCDERGGTVATREQTDGQIFKSGGTTGNPKYSLYSAQEWETICEYSGLMLAKGGLKNGMKVANLFYAGGMYASFLFTYSMLCSSSVKTVVYNLSGNLSVEEIVETLLHHQIDCLAGVPSILTKIVSYIDEKQLTGFAVDTVYYAGETLYPDQRKQFCEAFGRELDFRSISYASNDGGAIGYYTKECGFNEHRVMSDLCKLELIDPDTGEVITEMNRQGDIYITSLFKTLIPLIRYPAGDRGNIRSRKAWLTVSSVFLAGAMWRRGLVMLPCTRRTWGRCWKYAGLSIMLIRLLSRMICGISLRSVLRFRTQRTIIRSGFWMRCIRSVHL